MLGHRWDRAVALPAQHRVVSQIEILQRWKPKANRSLHHLSRDIGTINDYHVFNQATRTKPQSFASLTWTMLNNYKRASSVANGVNYQIVRAKVMGFVLDLRATDQRASFLANDASAHELARS